MVSVAKPSSAVLLGGGMHAVATGKAADADTLDPGAGTGVGVFVAKLLAEFHPQPAEYVAALVAFGDGPCAPPGIALRDLDDGPVPDNTIPTAHWNPAGMLFAVRILGPLRWFGLVECREPGGFRESRCWRKSALFDRFLSFDVQLSDSRAAGHSLTENSAPGARDSMQGADFTAVVPGSGHGTPGDGGPGNPVESHASV